MGFFRDVDEGKVGGKNSLNAEDMLDSLEDITIDDAFASLDGAMTAEEALASLDADYVKEMESAVEGLSDSDGSVDEIPDMPDDSAQGGEELTLEEVLADLPDMLSDNNTEDNNNESANAEEVTEDVSEATDSVSEGIDIADAGNSVSADNENMEDVSMAHETTVISKGTTIRGGISSDCSLDVMGVITGDVDCQGKLCIYGTVSGNTSASEIYVETSQKLNGDLISTGNVKISEKSVVIGTIQATSAFVAGAVKGDLDIDGPVVIDASAVIHGNITAKSLQLNTGAVLQGICNIGTKDTDINSIFAD